jgi:dipeptidyl aminopeptidase/acylaminoacyl peptidase
VFSVAGPNGAVDLYRKRSDGTGQEEVLLATPAPEVASDWSLDGRFLLYNAFVEPNAAAANDIWALPMRGDRKPFPVVQTAFEEKDAQFSPDGRWIAYQSNETGQFEIYLQQVPWPGAATADFNHRWRAGPLASRRSRTVLCRAGRKAHGRSDPVHA